MEYKIYSGLFKFYILIAELIYFVYLLDCVIYKDKNLRNWKCRTKLGSDEGLNDVGYRSMFTNSRKFKQSRVFNKK